jgi:hypothetical protein
MHDTYQCPTMTRYNTDTCTYICLCNFLKITSVSACKCLCVCASFFGRGYTILIIPQALIDIDKYNVGKKKFKKKYDFFFKSRNHITKSLKPKIKIPNNGIFKCNNQYMKIQHEIIQG